jgi:hypothetical protein
MYPREGDNSRGYRRFSRLHAIARRGADERPFLPRSATRRIAACVDAARRAKRSFKISVQRTRSARGNNLVTAAQVGDNSRKAGRMKHLLVVEPDAVLGQRLQARCEQIARATVCRDFLSARSQLLASAPDLLVTNLRLEEYNGLHLVLLAASDGVTRSVVHTDRPDPYLIREAQTIGAFFERTERLVDALVGYLNSPLPQRDRRNADRYDRRTAFRGGRRAADVALPA